MYVVFLKENRILAKFLFYLLTYSYFPVVLTIVTITEILILSVLTLVNFVRVLKPLFVFQFLGEFVLGGESAGQLKYRLG